MSVTSRVLSSGYGSRENLSAHHRRKHLITYRRHRMPSRKAVATNLLDARIPQSLYARLKFAIRSGRVGLARHQEGFDCELCLGKADPTLGIIERCPGRLISIEHKVHLAPDHHEALWRLAYLELIQSRR